MSKYYVYLADNWTKSEPFMTDWDYELIGDKLREEFDAYFLEQERLQDAGAGKTRQLLKGEFVKRFMITKRINLVDNPANGNLKSVFVLKVGEKKPIDARAKASLSRFEYVIREHSDGTSSSPLGFLRFEGSDLEKTTSKDAETFQIDGNDIEYFEEKEPKVAEVTEKQPEETPKEEFACEICGKSFTSNIGLMGHKRSHKVKEK